MLPLLDPPVLDSGSAMGRSLYCLNLSEWSMRQRGGRNNWGQQNKPSFLLENKISIQKMTLAVTRMWFCPPKKLSHSTSNNRYVICVIPPFQPVTFGSYTRLFAINTSRILGRFLVCEFFVRSGGKMFLWYLPVPFTICSSSFPRIHAQFPGSEDRGFYVEGFWPRTFK